MSCSPHLGTFLRSTAYVTQLDAEHNLRPRASLRHPITPRLVLGDMLPVSSHYSVRQLRVCALYNGEPWLHSVFVVRVFEAHASGYSAILYR